jgi:hypothetical protein
MASDSSKIWTLFSLGAAIGAAAVSKKVINTSWKAATGKNPPANPADPDYARSTGHLPPGMEKDGQDASAPTPVT